MKKTVLITGGSSGIGYEISKHFARAGYRLLWVAKPAQELADAKAKLQRKIEDAEIETLAKDLTETDASQEVFDWATNIATVDVLINNAGFGTYGFIQEIPPEKDLAMIQLHIVCVYQMTRLFLDDMLQRGVSQRGVLQRGVPQHGVPQHGVPQHSVPQRGVPQHGVPQRGVPQRGVPQRGDNASSAGTIINISSISAFQPITRMNTYASTKAFIHHFSQGLQEELAMQQSPINVITVCPASIQNSPFRKSGNMDNVKHFDGIVSTTAEEVASDVWKGFNAGKKYIVSGAKMRRLNLIRNLLPYWFKRYLIRKESQRR